MPDNIPRVIPKGLGVQVRGEVIGFTAGQGGEVIGFTAGGGVPANPRTQVWLELTGIETTPVCVCARVEE